MPGCRHCSLIQNIVMKLFSAFQQLCLFIHPLQAITLKVWIESNIVQALLIIAGHLPVFIHFKLTYSVMKNL